MPWDQLWKNSFTHLTVWIRDDHTCCHVLQWSHTKNHTVSNFGLYRYHGVKRTYSHQSISPSNTTHTNTEAWHTPACMKSRVLEIYRKHHSWIKITIRLSSHKRLTVSLCKMHRFLENTPKKTFKILVSSKTGYFHRKYVFSIAPFFCCLVKTWPTFGINIHVAQVPNSHTLLALQCAYTNRNFITVSQSLWPWHIPIHIL